MENKGGKMINKAATILALVAGILLTGCKEAEIVLDNVQKIILNSQNIVVAEAVAKKDFVDKNTGEKFTLVKFRVIETLAGNYSETFVFVRPFKGGIGTQSILGFGSNPSDLEGQAVLFLAKDADHNGIYQALAIYRADSADAAAPVFDQLFLTTGSASSIITGYKATLDEIKFKVYEIRPI